MNIINPYSQGIILASGETMKVNRKEIGAWNMVASASVSIAHGITRDNILWVDAWIINDAGTSVTNLGICDSTGNICYGWYSIDSTNIILSRGSAGDYNNVAFDDAVMNRGWFSYAYYI